MSQYKSPPLSEVVEENAEYTTLLNYFKDADAALNRIEEQDKLSDLKLENETQLRFAGYHLIKAIHAKDEISKKCEIDEAECHCKLVTATIYLFLTRQHIANFEIFERDYKEISINECFEKYYAHKEVLTEIQASCQEELSISNFTLYKESEAILSNILTECDHRRVSLNNRLTQHRKAGRWGVIINCCIVIGAIGVIFTAYVQLVTNYKKLGACEIYTADSLCTDGNKKTAKPNSNVVNL